MSRIKITILFLALCSTAGVPVRAQSALTQSIQPAPAASSAAGPTDPLGRNTPSNAILGFLRAAQDGDYSIAAQYLQMSAARRQTEGEQTASRLKFALDHAFSGNLSPYNQPEGTPQEDTSGAEAAAETQDEDAEQEASAPETEQEASEPEQEEE